MKKGLLLALIGCALLWTTEQSWGQGSNSAVLIGTVSDTKGNTLPSASVYVLDTPLGAITDRDGKFRITGLKAGSYTVRARYLGYRDQEQQVSLADGAEHALEFSLSASATQSSEVVVYGTLTRGQAKALNEQKNAPNIKNVVSAEQFSQFPDRNAAEAVQRIPGVSISHDQGEGESVMVRGISPEYNSMTLNGHRIPSPDPDDGRSVGLDLLQAELMESIVVTKALTPDMDADALGGTIAFNLMRAPERPLRTLAVGGGFNQQQSEFEDYGQDIETVFALFGQRFLDGKLGVIASGSAYRTNRGSILNQYTYTADTNMTIAEKRWNDYDVRRLRYGALAGLDFRFDSQNEVRASFNFNSYKDDEIRRKVDHIVADGEEEREIRNRLEDQSLVLFEVGGDHAFGGLSLDWSGAYIKAKEDMPDRTYWLFTRDNPYTGLNNQQLTDLTGMDTFPELGPYSLKRLRYDDAETEDEDKSGQVNLNMPFGFMKHQSTVKVGAKYLQKDRKRVRQRFNTTPLDGEAVTYTGAFDFIDVRFDDPQVDGLPLNEFTEDENRINEKYDATETVLAAYAMTNLTLSEQLSALAGLRFENTENSYTHVTAPNAVESSYSNILPSLHLTYRFADNTNVRLAATTGISRPEYTALVPREVVDDNEIDRGNPNLDPTSTKGLDLFFENYSSDLGLLSVGVFFKSLDDPLTSTTFEEVIDGETFEVSQPVNGESSEIFGFEIAFNRKLANMGIGFLEHFGVYANYSFTQAEVTINEREVQLPGSPKHTANLALMYDNAELGLSFAVTNNYRSQFLASVSSNERRDVWFDAEYHLDISASKTIFENLSVFLLLNNITDAEEKEVFGDPGEDFARIHQTEGYGMSGTLGFRYTIQ